MSCSSYRILSIKSPGGAYSFQAFLRGGGSLLERGGAYLRGGLIDFLRRLYDNFEKII